MVAPVRKAVVPAAGLGTRLLPLTKVVPKELLPAGDRPAIQHVAEEARSAGADELILVLSRRKAAVGEYFAAAPDLERWLAGQSKEDLLGELNRLVAALKTTSVYQDEPLGLGHAVLCAREAVGEEPFLVILPDDLGDAEPSLARQMVQVYEQYGSPVVALEQVADSQVERYGIIKGRKLDERIYEISDLVEKPPRESAPSNLAVIGRYVLPPEIFSLLEQVRPGAGGEIQLTDALRSLCRQRTLLGCEFRGRRYDTGTLLGLVETNLRLAMKVPEWRPALRSVIRELLRD